MANIAALAKGLKQTGVTVNKITEHDYSKCVPVLDPESNNLKIWKLAEAGKLNDEVA